MVDGVGTDEEEMRMESLRPSFGSGGDDVK